MKKTAIFIMGYLPAKWRDYLFGINRFRAKNRIYPQEQAIVFFTEKGKWHGGFCDRMKGIISLYHFCLCRDIPFKINYTFPFEISNFLLPNEYDWSIKKEAVTFHRKEAKLMVLYGKDKVKRLLQLKSKKQIHAFFNTDIIEQLNREFQTKYTWGELYNSLFKPTEELQNLLSFHKKTLGETYISAHFRFIGMLEDFEKRQNDRLFGEEKENLICRNLQIIDEIKKKYPNKTIFVATDSNVFANRAREIRGVYTLTDNILHIDDSDKEDHAAYLRVFLDFYLLSESESIFSVGTSEMYQSDYPAYAAKVNNIPFERILIK